jgi:hypothetical protein
MTESKVECLKFTSSNKEGGFLGFTNLWIPKMGLEIYGCTVYRNKKTGHRFLKFPAKEGKDKEGNTTWFEQVRFREKDHQAAFQKLALDAIDKWCAANQEQIQYQDRQQKDEDVPF